MRKSFKRTIRLGMLFILVVIWLSRIGETSAAFTRLSGVEENASTQVGPPWLDEAWPYRRPVTISNSGGYLPYYQVLIILDGSNFDFDHAKTDGSDIRITDGSGKTPIYFWIESWSYQQKLAYLWVLASSLPPNPYNTTLYLYSGNPSANSESDGVMTFDFFDDFLQFSGGACSLSSASNSPQPFSSIRVPMSGKDEATQHIALINPWCVLQGTPSVNSGILSLGSNSGIRTNYLFQFQAVGYRANYGLGTGYEATGYSNGSTSSQTIIGDLPGDPNGLYLINFPNDNSAPLGITGLHNGYHSFEIHWEHNSSSAYLDHNYRVSNGIQVPNSLLPILVNNNDPELTTTLKVDWLYVRQYRNPEPTSSVGGEQGLVDLQISTVDFPDPIQGNKDLTYLLTVTNISNIDAHTSVVTDTLPASVTFVSVNPAQGCHAAGKDVVCNISLLPANSFTSITIVGKTTIDGEITNTAFVNSTDYDKNLINNINKEGTLVDSVPPTVSWVEPTTQGQIFVSHGGPVKLSAVASDNDQVDYVEFWWNDNNSYILIDKVSGSPYQTTFNSNLLVPGIDFFFEARAYDRAGNSNVNSSRAYIYIRRGYPTYMPFLKR